VRHERNVALTALMAAEQVVLYRDELVALNEVSPPPLGGPGPQASTVMPIGEAGVRPEGRAAAAAVRRIFEIQFASLECDAAARKEEQVRRDAKMAVLQCQLSQLRWAGAAASADTLQQQLQAEHLRTQQAEKEVELQAQAFEGRHVTGEQEMDFLSTKVQQAHDAVQEHVLEDETQRTNKEARSFELEQQLTAKQQCCHCRMGLGCVKEEFMNELSRREEAEVLATALQHKLTATEETAAHSSGAFEVRLADAKARALRMESLVEDLERRIFADSFAREDRVANGSTTNRVEILMEDLEKQLASVEHSEITLARRQVDMHAFIEEQDEFRRRQIDEERKEAPPLSQDTMATLALAEEAVEQERNVLQHQLSVQAKTQEEARTQVALLHQQLRSTEQAARQVVDEASREKAGLQSRLVAAEASVEKALVDKMGLSSDMSEQQVLAGGASTAGAWAASHDHSIGDSSGGSIVLARSQWDQEAAPGIPPPVVTQRPQWKAVATVACRQPRRQGCELLPAPTPRVPSRSRDSIAVPMGQESTCPRSPQALGQRGLPLTHGTCAKRTMVHHPAPLPLQHVGPRRSSPLRCVSPPRSSPRFGIDSLEGTSCAAAATSSRAPPLPPPP